MRRASWEADALGRAAGLRRAQLCGSPGFTAAMTEEIVRCGALHFDSFAEAFAEAVEIPNHLQQRRIAVAGTDSDFSWMRLGARTGNWSAAGKRTFECCA